MLKVTKISLGAALWRLSESVAQRFSVPTIALATVCLLLTGAVGVRFLAALWNAPASGDYTFDYSIAANQRPVSMIPVADNAASGPPLTDPAARYAERLREATTLAVGLSLTAFDEFSHTHKFPQSLEALVAAAQTRSLLPPSLIWDARQQAFNGVAGRYWARYRVGAFGLEVLSAGFLGWADGEVFFLRVPDEAGQVLAVTDNAPRRSFAALWVADSPATLLPAPFQPSAQLPGRGWHSASLRPGATNPARLADLLVWLKTSAAASGGAAH